MKKALFLDRDGVICEAMPRGTYLLFKKDFKLIDGIVELVEKAKNNGYVVVVVTNQPQIAKGLLSEKDLVDIHNEMMLSFSGLIDKILYCPHIDEDECACRKPKPGMIHQAAEDLEIDLEKSLIVGDSHNDVHAGIGANIKTVFLKNQYNAHELAKCEPDFVAERLLDIIDFLPMD